MLVIFYFKGLYLSFLYLTLLNLSLASLSPKNGKYEENGPLFKILYQNKRNLCRIGVNSTELTFFYELIKDY